MNTQAVTLCGVNICIPLQGHWHQVLPVLLVACMGGFFRDALWAKSDRRARREARKWNVRSVAIAAMWTFGQVAYWVSWGILTWYVLYDRTPKMLESEEFFYPEWYVSSFVVLIAQNVPYAARWVFVQLFGYRLVSKDVCWNCGYPVSRERGNARCTECGESYEVSWALLRFFRRTVWMYLKLPAIRIGIMLGSVIAFYLTATLVPPTWNDMMGQIRWLEMYMLVPRHQNWAYLVSDGSKYQLVTEDGSLRMSARRVKGDVLLECALLESTESGEEVWRPLPIVYEYRDPHSGFISRQYQLPRARYFPNSDYARVGVSIGQHNPTAAVNYPSGVLSIERVLPERIIANDQTPGGTN